MESDRTQSTNGKRDWYKIVMIVITSVVFILSSVVIPWGIWVTNQVYNAKTAEERCKGYTDNKLHIHKAWAQQVLATLPGQQVVDKIEQRFAEQKAWQQTTTSKLEKIQIDVAVLKQKIDPNG